MTFDMNAYMRERRKKKRRAGICEECQKPVVGRRRRCPEHLAMTRRNDYVRKLRAMTVEALHAERAWLVEHIALVDGALSERSAA